MTKAATALKICGLTDVSQACSIAAMGVQAIGIIGVQITPRFVEEHSRRAIFDALKRLHSDVDRVWVVADPCDSILSHALHGSGTPSIVQLHGEETPERCIQLKERYPWIQWWKALRLRAEEDLAVLHFYEAQVDALLLDAWNPDQLGGTGHRIDPGWLNNLHKQLRPSTIWWLAGGISAEWVPELLCCIKPHGFDASSRLEVKAGVKDLNKVRALVDAIHDNQPDQQ